MKKRPARRAALYVRVSTADKQHPANQTAPLALWSKKAGHIVVKQYIDRESGSTSTRPAFQEMLAAARRHEFDLVVFWSLDRFSREGIAATFEHLKTLAGHQVDFYSLQDPFCRSLADDGDLAARAQRELLMALAAWIAEYERRRRQERVKAGMERARQEGKQIGRRRTRFLTTADKTRLMDMRARGYSFRAIAKELDQSKSTIERRFIEEQKRQGGRHD
jgi:DNA invertase Pin-like site-specific DNA recombinase